MLLYSGQAADGRQHQARGRLLQPAVPAQVYYIYLYLLISTYIYTIYNQIFTISRSVPSCAANVTAAFTVTRDIDWTGTFGETRWGIYTYLLISTLSTCYIYTIYMYLHAISTLSTQGDGGQQAGVHGEVRGGEQLRVQGSALAARPRQLQTG